MQFDSEHTEIWTNIYRNQQNYRKIQKRMKALSKADLCPYVVQDKKNWECAIKINTTTIRRILPITLLCYFDAIIVVLYNITTFMIYLILKNNILEILRNYILFYLTPVRHLITSNVLQKAHVLQVGHPWSKKTQTMHFTLKSFICIDNT